MKTKVKMLIALFVVLGGLSCGEESVPRVDADAHELSTDALVPQDVWICYHPGTKYHDKLCVEGEFPTGCYVSGDDSRFCWLLTDEECASRTNNEYWRKYCGSL